MKKNSLKPFSEKLNYIVLLLFFFLAGNNSLALEKELKTGDDGFKYYLYGEELQYFNTSKGIMATDGKVIIPDYLGFHYIEYKKGFFSASNPDMERAIYDKSGRLIIPKEWDVKPLVRVSDDEKHVYITGTDVENNLMMVFNLDGKLIVPPKAYKAIWYDDEKGFVGSTNNGYQALGLYLTDKDIPVFVPLKKKGVININKVKFDTYEKGEKGLSVNFNFDVTNYQNEKIHLVAYFYKGRNGEKGNVVSEPSYYTTNTGSVCTSQAYRITNENIYSLENCELFIPYEAFPRSYEESYSLYLRMFDDDYNAISETGWYNFTMKHKPIAQQQTYQNTAVQQHSHQNAASHKKYTNCPSCTALNPLNKGKCSFCLGFGYKFGSICMMCRGSRVCGNCGGSGQIEDKLSEQFFNEIQYKLNEEYNQFKKANGSNISYMEFIEMKNQPYRMSSSSSSSNSYNSNVTPSRKNTSSCGLCRGSGREIRTDGVAFGITEKYCQECKKKVFNPHYHAPCRACSKKF